MRTLAVSSVIALLAAGCGGNKDPDKKSLNSGRDTLGLHDSLQLTVSYGPRWLGVYESRPAGFSTKSYWIEGPDGVVLIDTQFLPSAGVEAAELAETVTGKPVVAAIVLHANPDKFNGTAALQKRGVKVYTSAQVVELIPEIHKLRHSWFYDRYEPDYPDKTPAPDSFGADTREFEVAGVTLKLHVLGPGCSLAHVVVEYEGHMFVGDLVASLGHAWLELGLIDQWMHRLEEIEALGPSQIHPGRGPSGGPELLVRQRMYRERVVTYVTRENPSLDVADKDKAEAIARIKQRLMQEFPGYPNATFIEIGLPEVWDKLAPKP